MGGMGGKRGMEGKRYLGGVGGLRGMGGTEVWRYWRQRGMGGRKVWEVGMYEWWKGIRGKEDMDI